MTVNALTALKAAVRRDQTRTVPVDKICVVIRFNSRGMLMRAVAIAAEVGLDENSSSGEGNSTLGQKTQGREVHHAVTRARW